MISGIPGGLVVGLLDYGEIIVTIILVNIESTIIQTIIFEFEKMMYLILFSMSPKKRFVTENLYTKWSDTKFSNLN